MKCNLAVDKKPCACSWLVICVVFILIANTTTIADNKHDTSQVAFIQRKPAGPYCGVYCLYTAMKLAGSEVDFIELLKPEYLGSPKGSSLAELKKAAENKGIYAVPLTRLTSRALRKSPYPVILHVKSSADKKEYDHFELFLGTENAQAKLFDPPEITKLVPFHELAVRWNGNGLIVSTRPINVSTVFLTVWKQLAVCAAITITIILMVRWGRQRWSLFMAAVSVRRLLGLSIAQGFGLVSLASMGAMIYHFANDAGLLANANATAVIQQSHEGSFIPKISEREVHKLLDSDTVFIDARFARDYKAGHLDGAISVSVDANDVELQKATAKISKDSRIVIYCQSAGCKFAEKVAIKLQNDGYSNISIYKGGWADWVAKNGKKKDTSS